MTVTLDILTVTIQGYYVQNSENVCDLSVGGEWRKHRQSSDKSTNNFHCEINGNTKEIIEYDEN